VSLIPVFEIGVRNAWILLFCVLLHAFLLSVVFKGALQKKEPSGDIQLTRTEKRINTVRLMVLVLMFAYSVFLPLPLGTPWFYIGLAIYLAGLAMYTSVMASFAATPPDRPATTGLYRYSRHPQYLTQVLTFVGAGIGSASWVLLLFSAAFAVMLPLSVRFEESHTLARFGDTYRTYVERTPRWVGVPKRRLPRND